MSRQAADVDEWMPRDKCLELARLHHALKHKQLSVVQCFLDKNDANQRVPDNAFFRDLVPAELIGATLLHLAHAADDANAYRLLLTSGADFTLKDRARDSTVVHRIVEDSYHVANETSGRFKNPFLAATLFAHYEYAVRRNPCNPRGITHLHAACMANSADAVLRLLTPEAVDQAVRLDSPYYPGYTPLHFAARFSELCTLEIIKILTKHGADVELEDKYGMTPLDVLVERHGKIVETMELADGYGCTELFKALVANEKIIGFLGSRTAGWELRK